MRLSHGCAIGLRLTHINITSVRLSHSCGKGLRLTHINITSISILSIRMQRTYIRYIYHTYIQILGECTALHYCRASVRELLYCALVFHIHFLFPLAYISRNYSLILRSCPPLTLACKTAGGECLGTKGYQMYASVCGAI